MRSPGKVFPWKGDLKKDLGDVKFGNELKGSEKCVLINQLQNHAYPPTKIILASRSK